MRYLWLPVLLVSLLVVPVSSYADDLADGLKAYDAKDYKRAYELLLPLADKGNAAAQYRIGVILDAGHGIKPNPAAAVAYYDKAARSGVPAAAFNLGLLYFDGRGVEKDYASSVRYFSIAAEQGDVDGQLNLGLMYAAAKGVPRDFEKSFQWLFIAADSGSQDASYAIGKFRQVVSPSDVEKGRRLATEWQRHH